MTLTNIHYDAFPECLDLKHKRKVPFSKMTQPGVKVETSNLVILKYLRVYIGRFWLIQKPSVILAASAGSI